MGESSVRQVDKSTGLAIVIYYCLMMVAIGVVGIATYLTLRMDWIIWYTSAYVLLHIAWIVIILNFNYETEKYFIPHYYIFMVTYSFPVALFLWQMEVYTILLLYMLLPLMILFRYHNLKNTIYAGVSSVVIIAAIIIISAKIQLLHNIDVNKNIIFFLNIFIMFAAMAFIILFLSFYSKILKQTDNEKLTVVENEEKTQEANNAQLKGLYNNVINYFEKKQPYLQQNYRLAMLAAELNTNVKYLSEAINTYYGGTFENLLNKYRLEFVKKMLDDRLAEKYTMEYIYTMAGYSSRATFYENFRKTFKMSPLDYQEMKKLKNIGV